MKLGTPALTVKEMLAKSFPSPLLALIWTVAVEYRALGTPEMTPVVPFRDNPAGSAPLKTV